MADKKIIQKIIDLHRPFSYCYVGVLRDILHYYGHNLSEYLIYGLMGGLNFFYSYPDVQIPGYAPLFWISGDPDADPRDTFCSTLGIYQDSGITADPDESWEIVKSMVDRNQPVMIDVAFSGDYITCLNVPFFVKKLGKIMNDGSLIDFTVGGQKAAVVGYDLDEDIVYILDSMVAGVNKVPLSVLKTARSLTDCYIPPRNEWSVYYIPQKLIPLEIAIKDSILLSVHNMLNFSKYDHLNVFTGIHGMRKLVDDLPYWLEMADEKTVRQSAYFIHILGWSTGRGQFRPFFSHFLKEASDIIHEDRLKPLANMYKEISLLWADVCKSAKLTIFSVKKGLLQKGSLKKLKTIVDRETEAIMMLKEISDSWE